MPTPEKQRRRTKIALWCSAGATLIALTAAGVTLVDRFHDTNTQRTLAHQRDIAIANSIRTVLCLARDQVVNDKTIPSTRRDLAIHFYDKALRSIHAQPCAPLTVRPRR